jgi:dTDP-4-dehydrorhamnose 3,5-epimerase
MKFTACPIIGAWLIDMEPAGDERGFFARSHCVSEFGAHGLDGVFRQSSVSFNALRGTLRGLHYQAAPHAETKLVRCTAGAVFDAIVDLRPESDSYGRWFAAELSAANRRSLYIPAGCAHGFLTLTDAAELLYMISTDYVPGAARGLRWDDPAIGIRWPFAPLRVSARDAGLPTLAAAAPR